MAYAATTKVPVNQTRDEIEAMLRRAKADLIVTMAEPTSAVVMFRLIDRLIRFDIAIAADASDQVRRSRWRALALVIKAKLEAVESKITTAEEEFLAHVVMPNGQSFGSYSAPVLRAAIEDGRMPASPLLIEGPKQ